jgi:hypothetical protein
MTVEHFGLGRPHAGLDRQSDPQRARRARGGFETGQSVLETFPKMMVGPGGVIARKRRVFKDSKNKLSRKWPLSGMFCPEVHKHRLRLVNGFGALVR